MKTIASFCLACALLVCGFESSFAQSAASSSKDVTPTDPNNPANRPLQSQNQIQTFGNIQPIPNSDGSIEPYKVTRGLPMTAEMERLLGIGKTQEALIEFEKLKKSNPKATKFDLLYLEMTIYREAAYNDPDSASVYAQKEKDLVAQLTEQFPNMSDVVMLQLTPNSSYEEIINVTSKAIELDQTNTIAYEQRGRILFMVGRTKEACADFEHLPYKTSLPEYQWCKDLTE
ncbi:MAG: tetratricopeptide repeat protein [Bacteroides sp.]|nr:tetratricopeptide repeat protein [Bacteroides sp.]